MARSNAPTDEVVDDAIDRGDDGGLAEPTARRGKKLQPTYQVRGESKIPISKSHGKLWKSRQQQAMSKREQAELVSSWDEAIRYYRNDQNPHRGDADDGESAGNLRASRKSSNKFSETENIVFANTSALVPLLYAKNPTCEVTGANAVDDVAAASIEKLLNRLLSMRSSPGLNLKPKVRKAVVMTTLTNVSYIEVGWTFREQSSQQAMEDLGKLSTELTKAKNAQEVEEIEGKIMALEDRIELLRPAGPWCKFRRPHDVLVDDDSVDEDHADAKWMMIADYVSTSWINAVYAKKNGQDQYTSIYKPTHIINGGGGRDGQNDVEAEVLQYSLLDSKQSGSFKDYGYEDEATFKSAQRTKVWYVWDRVTQRVYLYNDSDWTWPIWVWDDPYHLQSFFPIFKLQFYTDPEEPIGKSEVTYYLDQQDAINQINSEFKMARQWARRNLFYDKSRVSKDEVEAMLKGDEEMAIGVDVPEGMELGNFVQAFVPPSMQFIELFDKKPILEAIDRVSSVQPVMRGVEFKTNTTNRAIEQYNSTQQTRMDEKIDAVEDLIGRIAWAVAQLALQFMPEEMIASLVGTEAAASWINLTPTQIMSDVQMTVTGGSTAKPTTEAKKQQALQMGQVLGQFVNAAPQPVLMVMLNTMRKAFNDVIPEEEWRSIMEAVGAPPTAPAPSTASGEGGASSERARTNGGAPSEQGQGEPPAAALAEMIDALPPEAKQALGTAMAQGVPMQEALARIVPATQPAQGNA